MYLGLPNYVATPAWPYESVKLSKFDFNVAN